MTPWVIAGAAAYATAVGAMWLMQDGLIFPVSATMRRYDDPFPTEAERLTLQTPDGETLVGHLVRRPRSRGLVLGFQGNAWHGDDFFAYIARHLPDHDVAAFHYRGYEPSTGRPSEKALVEDAAMIFDTLADIVAPQRVIAAGFSIGTGVAAQLAAKRPVDGVLLVTPFDSIEAVAQERYPWIPVRSLITHPFRSDAALAGKPVPAALIVAGQDRVVPPERARALQAKLERVVYAKTVAEASHNDLYEREEFPALLNGAVASLEKASARRLREPAPAP